MYDSKEVYLAEWKKHDTPESWENEIKIGDKGDETKFKELSIMN